MGITEVVPGKKWRVRYGKRNPKTEQPVTLTRHAKTEAEAKRKLRIMIADVERRIAEKIIPKWRSAIEGYLQSCRENGLSEKSIYNAEKCLNAGTLERWGDNLVTEITTQNIRDLIDCDYADYSQSHKQSMLKFIRQVFEYCLAQGDINRNPTPRLAFRVGDKIKKVLTEEQARLLLIKAKELNSPWYPIWATALYTGMRSGELFALTWDNVNLNDRKILVNCAWNNKDKFKETKSGDDRVVEIATSLVPILQELKLKTSRFSNFVLPHMREWEKGDQARELRKFLVGIGLPEVRFHDLRATWATLMLSKGIAPAKVMMMGGWKDMKTMMIYMRKAGIDITGITTVLDGLHNPKFETAKVLDFRTGSNL